MIQFHSLFFIHCSLSIIPLLACSVILKKWSFSHWFKDKSDPVQEFRKVITTEFHFKYNTCMRIFVKIFFVIENSIRNWISNTHLNCRYFCMANGWIRIECMVTLQASSSDHWTWNIFYKRYKNWQYLFDTRFKYFMKNHSKYAERAFEHQLQFESIEYKLVYEKA